MPTTVPAASGMAYGQPCVREWTPASFVGWQWCSPVRRQQACGEDSCATSSGAKNDAYIATSARCPAIRRMMMNDVNRFAELTPNLHVVIRSR
jgi:hypothetical protein